MAFFYTVEDNQLVRSILITDSESLSKSLNILNILKDDNRSFVALFEYKGNKHVFKIPREKNTRKWIRFTTLYRKSEVMKNYLNLLKLQQLGISTNKPIICGEKRDKGKVIDSFIIYSYLEGESITVDDYPLLIKEIQRIHSLGRLHGDFHSKNFLQTEDRISFLDTNFRLNLFGNLGKCYEMVYFLRNDRTDESLRPIHREFIYNKCKSISLFLANAFYDWLEIWRSIKRWIRNLHDNGI